MLTNLVVLVVAFSYLALLFIIAAWGDRRAEQGRSVVNSPTIYALSIAVYCTAWTFYGSVGRAATTGLSFLLIYLGPTLAMLCGWLVLRKMIRIAQSQRITSIADFISARYGKSGGLGMLVALIAVVAIMPYIALQLKAITVSYGILTEYPNQRPPALSLSAFWDDKAFWVALVLAVFIILFGTRHLDASERHEGMVTAIAFESLVKLCAFIAVGIFACFILYPGPGALLERAGSILPDAGLHFGLDQIPGGPLGWFGTLILATLAFITLPRQFQVLVVENVNEHHLRRACWLFPLYLLLINLFVIPIALAGLAGSGTGEPDNFVLTLPLSAGLQWLPLLVFIGGLSAATSMMIVETIALSTMVSNQLVMPLLLRWRRLHLDRSRDLSGWLLGIRRIAIILILILGYLYHALIGEAYSLVTIGLVSFAAAAQFAPSLLLGLYWRGASRNGAAAGLLAGILVWAWTLLIPGFALSGWMSTDFIEHGPFGWSLLRPYALFGLENWDIYTHSLFWSMLANISLLVGVSLFSRQSHLEQTQAALFTNALRPEAEQAAIWQGQANRYELFGLLSRYLGRSATLRLFDGQTPALDDDSPAPPALIAKAQQELTGALGSATARILINSVVRGEALDLASILSILDTTSQTLEYNRRLEQKSAELERIGHELRSANERLLELDRLKDEFVAMVSHELRTPLTSIRAFAEILSDADEMPADQQQHFLQIIVRESERLSRLIEEILDLARLESGRMTLHPQPCDLTELCRQAVDGVTQLFQQRAITFTLQLPDTPCPLMADPDRLLQVLINLLDNASKFANADQPEVLLSLQPGKRRFRVNVEDNGPGILAQEREKVFEKFHQTEQQADSGSHNRPRGTGLGLPISRGIINHLGGRLWVDEPQHLAGACLALELPVARDEQQDKAVDQLSS
ncbi:histidine kinase dimerization/phospho-acceptor domain-containing protein [Marinobacterium marinum]|uniref:histidine kinase n=1 Tax=Marinobacterium marinum TaxID=2756129 RepID=A0A7W1WX17_9GAMM|nr:histidine kinase dimerization/phospho-acceptor domain-containing protein [Marinobacterium marinum]MBA4501743.1 histidine kinase [Marinobacterium marinum]